MPRSGGLIDADRPGEAGGTGGIVPDVVYGMCQKSPVPIFGSSLSEASDADDMIDARVCARASSCVCQTSAFQGTPDIFSLLLPGHLEGHLLSEHHYGTEVGWDRSQTKPLQRCYAYYAYDVYFAYCAYIP